MTFDDIYKDVTRRLDESQPIILGEDSPAFRAMAAHLEDAKVQHMAILDRQLYADIYGIPPPPPVPRWRRALRRAKYYVLGVWGAVKDLGRAIIGKPHECESDW